MRKSFFSLLILGAILVSPLLTQAHVKWFTELEPQKETIEAILSPTFIIIALFIAFVLSVLPQVLPKVMEYKYAKQIDSKLDGFRMYSRAILKYGTAIALIVQILNGTLFAPELPATSNLIIFAAWAAIILLVIPIALAPKLAAIILLGLFGIATAEHGIFYMLDYSFYLAIIGVLLLENTKWSEWSFPFLYLGTGLSLCWVAVEKWVYPAMSIDIIQNHGVPTFGFDAALFVILSAFIEFVVGYLLVVGILNRLLAFVLTGIFFMTTLLFGWVEVVGHLMIHFLLIIFIIEGVSFYNPPIKIHKSKVDQMIFVFLNFIFVLSTFILIYYRFA
ncbi:DoxX family membrane protein [Mesobacillus harenae]|uniref:DoxX family membrane protein n=1 Tax=Mesobacillus harenae TaxID=2213203 RepID=UPI0015803852|nr:DoxX family membrane protein [Mesobacillus harenae]